MTMLAINWGNALIITVIGFSLVFAVLMVLIGVIVIFGKIFARKAEQTQAAPAVPAVSAADSGEEEMAAVAFALHMYYDMHDEESDVLTIRHEDTPYWPLSQENNVTF